MTRVKRRMLFGLVLVVLVVLGLGAWAYFYGTRITLERAEAFQFRRMVVAQLEEQATYRFFYVSNRRLVPGDGSLEERFETEREPMLKFGSFDTEIEPTLGIGMIINPTEWFQNEEIKLRNVRPLDQTAFVEQVRRFVQGSPYRSLLVVIHGFREGFPSALRKTAFLGHVLDINTPVLLFDWPGNQGSSLRGYRRARRVAKASGAELARLLELVIREIQPARLWLIANSMGGQVVADAFSRLYRQADLADAQTEIENVVLTAPDVDHEEFNNRFKQEINALTGNLTVYVSSNDRALLMSRIINRRLRLGESTLRPENPAQAEAAAALAKLVDPDSERITLVDVTPVNRTRNFHNFSLETPEFFNDLYVRLTNKRMPTTRELYRLQAPGGAVYWVLTRGR
ncbi:MAG: alpha/beta hydrolase [Acidiferrobacterales bacterium]